MKTQLERIATSLEIIAALLQKKKAPRKEYNADAAEQMRQVWNQYTPNELPKVKELNPSSTRARNAAARFLEKPEREYWAKVCLKIGSTKFCLGDNERAWLADFEFFVRPDTHLKVLEGKYDNLHKTKGQEAKAGKIVSYLPDGTPVLSFK